MHLKISKKNFEKMTDGLIRSGKTVAGVIKRENDFIFDEITKASDLRLNYDKPTLMPPGKKYFLPPKEILFYFDGEETFQPAINERELIIIGVKPYDIWAIKLMDKIFIETEPVDPYYESRRKNSVIIAIDDLNPFPACFSRSLKTHNSENGFDILLTDIGKNFIMAIGSEKGRKILEEYANLAAKATLRDLKKKTALLKAAELKYKIKITIPPKEIPGFLEKNYDNPFWEEMAKNCLSCGRCNMVCPTCICFDIEDSVELNLSKGKREREWHGCALETFAKTALGHNFRKETADRLRHRIMRKLSFLPGKFGLPGCVGCGRCINACKSETANPVDTIEKLKRRK